MDVTQKAEMLWNTTESLRKLWRVERDWLRAICRSEEWFTRQLFKRAFIIDAYFTCQSAEYAKVLAENVNPGCFCFKNQSNACSNAIVMFKRETMSLLFTLVALESFNILIRRSRLQAIQVILSIHDQDCLTDEPVCDSLNCWSLDVTMSSKFSKPPPSCFKSGKLLA